MIGQACSTNKLPPYHQLKAPGVSYVAFAALLCLFSRCHALVADNDRVDRARRLMFFSFVLRQVAKFRLDRLSETFRCQIADQVSGTPETPRQRPAADENIREYVPFRRLRTSRWTGLLSFADLAVAALSALPRRATRTRAEVS